jgi:predicted outer membrane repeat protein
MINFVIILLNFCISEAVIYVNANGPNGDGKSWASAYNNLQDALTSAKGLTVQIWVAKGIYKPTLKYGAGYNGTESNLVTFNISSGNSLYGGFKGSETSISQRNLNQNPTILSGDISGNDISGSTDNKIDNAWHVITADGVTAVVIDSFIIENGYAGGPDAGTVIAGAGGITFIETIEYVHDLGGGVIARRGAKITLNNIIFRDNMANSSRATIITINPPVVPLAAGGGALGICEESTLVTVTSSTFTNNLATMVGTDGGAVNVIIDANLNMIGSTLTGNKGNRNGGAVHMREAGNVVITSSVFTSNLLVAGGVGDESGGAIGAFNSNLTVTSCTFNSNTLNGGVGSGAIFFHTPFDDGEIYKLFVVSSIFTGNIGRTLGGAINIFGITPNAGVTAEVTSCVFTNNVAETGGGIYVDSIPTKVTSCVFNSNKAGVCGAAIFGSNFADAIFNITQLPLRSKLTVTSSSFNSNSLITPSPSVLPPAFVLGFLAQAFSGGTASVTTVPVGGAGIASVFGGNVYVLSSVFTGNNANTGRGGALLIGGSVGSAGNTPYAMNQAFLSVSSSSGSGNTDQTGPNNVAVLNPTGLPSTPNGVYFVTDGSIL